MNNIKTKKILSFITNGELFLILRNNSEDPKHGGDFWFTVTGGVENNEDDLSAVKREIKEETNLNVKEIIPLNWGSCYEIDGVTCEEHNYLSFVDDKTINLNEEHIDYSWVILPELINQIYWIGDKSILQKVLEKGMRRESFFKQLTIE